MADKIIKAMDIHNGNIINVLPNASGMYVDTETGKQYNSEDIDILTDEEVDDINRRKQRYEEVMKCTDWDAYTIEISKIVLPHVISAQGLNVPYVTMKNAAEATNAFVKELQLEMMKTYKTLRP